MTLACQLKSSTQKSTNTRQQVTTKLPRFTPASQGRHHEEARRKDREAKLEMKRWYDIKHRTRLVEINPGDWAYVRRNFSTTTRGTWDPTPYHNHQGDLQ